MKSNLKKLRKEAGLTMQELAKMAGTCKSQIHELEKDSANPTMETAFKIAKTLKAEVTDIWDYTSLTW